MVFDRWFNWGKFRPLIHLTETLFTTWQNCLCKKGSVRDLIVPSPLSFPLTSGPASSPRSHAEYPDFVPHQDGNRTGSLGTLSWDLDLASYLPSFQLISPGLNTRGCHLKPLARSNCEEKRRPAGRRLASPVAAPSPPAEFNRRMHPG